MTPHSPAPGSPKPAAADDTFRSASNDSVRISLSVNDPQLQPLFSVLALEVGKQMKFVGPTELEQTSFTLVICPSGVVSIRAAYPKTPLIAPADGPTSGIITGVDLPFRVDFEGKKIYLSEEIRGRESLTLISEERTIPLTPELAAYLSKRT